MNIKCEANANQQYLIIMLYSSFYTLRGSLNTRAVFSSLCFICKFFHCCIYLCWCNAPFSPFLSSIHLFNAYLSSPPLSLSIYLSHSPAHTWLSSSHPNIFRGEIIFSVKHPAVHRFTICCKQTWRHWRKRYRRRL